MAKLNKTVSLRPNRNCNEYRHSKKPTDPPYLLGNIQSAKSKKKFQIVEGVQAGRELPATTPYLSKEHTNGKK